MTLRVLVAGAGAAPLRLAETLRATEGVDVCVLAVGTGRPGLAQLAAHEFRYRPPQPIDPFTLANRDPDFPAQIEALAAGFAPSVMHLHGLASFGAEIVGHVRRAAPAATILLSQDDLALPCPHHGSLRTRPASHPCPGITPPDCAACFPERDSAASWLRNRWLGVFLDACDRIALADETLLAAHRAWGLADDRLTVLPPVPPEPVPPRAADGVLRAGLLDVSPLGALAPALAALRRLDDGSGAIALHLLADPAALPDDLIARAAELLADAPAGLCPFGERGPAEMDVLIGRAWQAHAFGRVAMAAEDATALADALERWAALPHRLADATAALKPATPREAVARHIELYLDLHAGR